MIITGNYIFDRKLRFIMAGGGCQYTLRSEKLITECGRLLPENGYKR